MVVNIIVTVLNKCFLQDQYNNVLIFFRYRWLCYINPNFYGFSASAVILLSDFESDCEKDGGSQLECYTSSGKYIINTFSFDTINPYRNMVVSCTSTAIVGSILHLQ